MRLTPILLLASAWVQAGELKLVSLFSDHAVLQAGEAAVFGKAHPGAKVDVALGAVRASAVAGPDGNWKTLLGGLTPTEEGKDLVVSSGEEVFTAHDVIVGEVWVGSGQSNMEFTVGGSSTAAEAKKRPKDNGLRMFTVARVSKLEPAEDVRGSWKVAAPESVGGFSAVAYYFGRQVREDLRRPVGVIHASIGGTRAEAWGPAGMYADVPEAKGVEEREVAGLRARTQAEEKKTGKPGAVWANGFNVNWNGMVAPWVGYSVRGAVWYQGEANAGKAVAYRWILGSMIKAWHKAWGGEFPFIIVQLPRFKAKVAEPVQESDWALIRESMEWIADNIPGAMMSVNIDLGEEKNIHPRDKLPVGERLAAVALQRVYKTREVGQSPRVVKAEAKGDAWVLTYDRAVVLKGEGKGFALRAKDGKWAAATAKAEGTTVTLTAPGITAPTEARYAWADFPEVSVYSAGADGLPAGPWRSAK